MFLYCCHANSHADSHANSHANSHNFYNTLIAICTISTYSDLVSILIDH